MLVRWLNELWYVKHSCLNMWFETTGWQRPTKRLIFLSYFPQKGLFSVVLLRKETFNYKALYALSLPCRPLVGSNVVDINHVIGYWLYPFRYWLYPPLPSSPPACTNVEQRWTWEKQKEKTTRQLPIDDFDLWIQRETKEFGCPGSAMYIQYNIYMYAGAHAESTRCSKKIGLCWFCFD